MSASPLQFLPETKDNENYNQIDYNSLISRTLRQAAWKQEVRIVKEIGLRCDFEKNGIWIEVEFGNARVYYQNYIKFLLALRYQEARFGILLCPTNVFAQLLCDLGQRRAALKRKSSTEHRPTYSGMMSYEKAIRELPFPLLSAKSIRGAGNIRQAIR
jgi:hypothetical protein